ncbi:MAG: hypothetical protein JSV86_08780 [Gemmatimonadota bacterium]|nr:MAG: hypothetical protein JSV86_08780 [Gemmatimonadota bacterium]
MIRYRALMGVLTALVVAGCGAQSGNLEELDLYEASLYFTGGRDRERLPRLSLVRDATNNRVAVKCLSGASSAELEELRIDDLEERLSTLEDGNVVEVADDGSRSVAFPAFVGRDREGLAEVAEAKARELRPLVEGFIVRLRSELGDRQEMLFHVLWSRVIDEIWTDAWRLSFPNEDLPTVAWLVYPEHEFAVGTNYGSTPGGGSLALTWSRKFTDQLSAFPEANYELFKTAWGESFENAEVRSELEGYGVFEASGDSRLFLFHRDGHLDSLRTGMVMEYAEAVSRAFDWQEIGGQLDIHPGDAFVVVLHEVAYAIFERLYHGQLLEIPSLLLDGREVRQAVRLASLELDESPGPLDEVMALYMGNGWHASGEVVAAFEEARRHDPDNPRLLWYLGLSLYDHRALLGGAECLGAAGPAHGGRSRWAALARLGSDLDGARLRCCGRSGACGRQLSERARRGTHQRDPTDGSVRHRPHHGQGMGQAAAGEPVRESELGCDQ